MRFINLIPNMVNAFEIKKGSVVLLNFWGENCDLEILDKFTIEIAKNGGIPVRWQNSRELIKLYYEEVDDEHLKFQDKYFQIFKLADVVIDIFMHGIAPHKDFPKDKFPIYAANMRKLFNALTEEKDLFIQVRVPTEENAKDEDMDYIVYEEAICNALSIDFNKLKEECTKIINKLSYKNNITIYTENNNILTFNLENRKWHKDDGTGDIPCGEIYIAPVEESANGSILITKIILQGKTFLNVLLEFKRGKLVNCSLKDLVDFIKEFKGDSNIIAEFGIGLNENVKELVGCAVIDEKSRGTAHIAIGMNNMFGGNNSSRLHMDFIFVPEKIEVDGELLMKGSKLLF